MVLVRDFSIPFLPFIEWPAQQQAQKPPQHSPREQEVQQ